MLLKNLKFVKVTKGEQMSIERKLRRKNSNKKKKLAEKEMATKVALFGQLGTECLTCKKSFDKLNREQVTTWSVVVREQEEKVNLYCPDCWKKAVDLIKDMKEGLLERRKEKE
tara:strand:- start:258 stop:596 length:339 start_codon:yes stop_codon:yes gene_type:complete